MVKLIIDDIHGLLKDIQGKELLCYGAGNYFEEIMNRYSEYGLSRYVKGIVDGNEKLRNQHKKYQDRIYPIITKSELINITNAEKIVLLITNYHQYMDIIEELDDIEAMMNVHVYVGYFLHIKYSSGSVDKNYFSRTFKYKIPKIIHYCWFGKGNIPDEYQKYMESWSKYCPDYEIKRWDESNYDISKNLYMKQAYEHKKWAFVSDYARVDIINEYGGIYLDTDVELLKPWDLFLENEFFAGFEDYNHINLGLGFGSVKNHPYLTRLLELYEDIYFAGKDGLNQIPCPVYQSKILNEMGFDLNNTYQKKDNMTIYPTSVFAPISFVGMGTINQYSYSVHHYSATWHSKEKKQYIDEQRQRGMRLYERYIKNE
jgi:hypothetical protein